MSHTRQRTRISWLLAVALHGCNSQTKPTLNPATPPLCPPRSMNVSRPDPQLGALNIIGGVLSSGRPEVVEFIVSGAAGTSRCTGTFHSDAVMITAAHCFEGLARRGPITRVMLASTGEPALEWFWHQSYVGNKSIGNPPFGAVLYRFVISALPSKVDLAAVRFQPSASHLVVPISDAPRRNGQPVRIVGFGFDAQAARADAAGYDPGPQPKREAQSSILELYDETIVLAEGGEGIAPRAAQGDSGGTVFDTNTNQALGIMSSVIFSAITYAQNAAQDPIYGAVAPRVQAAVDLLSPTASGFFTQIEQRWGITIRTSSQLPQIGSSPLPSSSVPYSSSGGGNSTSGTICQ